MSNLMRRSANWLQMVSHEEDAFLTLTRVSENMKLRYRNTGPLLLCTCRTGKGPLSLSLNYQHLNVK
ncbi:hypothetical protein Tcan_09055 [Toxocara canis]|uniref:Uncharacterized protein n=1 Tax=Toxocara canis TaxID=6265 RepID=A0A0B2VBV6_TOXCA|nr:hypothetical protein Tcan_09055 [Toxocara canis]